MHFFLSFLFPWGRRSSSEKELFFVVVFLLFQATPVAYGGSQARSLIRATAACLHHSHIWATSAIYTTAHGNARFLTHWVRPGITPATSWFLVRVVSAEPRWELPIHHNLDLHYTVAFCVCNSIVFKKCTNHN